jgi:hypothetical protein
MSLFTPFRTRVPAMKSSMHVALLLASTLLAFGCRDPQRCSTNKASLADEGPLMEPGGDCIGCHSKSDEGPAYSLAGTVMAATDDDDRCVGVGGLTVEITDANGAVLELTTNAVGNFFWSEPVAMPYEARVVGPNGSSRAMATPQSSGACGSCHTASGDKGAPGRILPP